VQESAVAAGGVGGDVGLLVEDDNVVPGRACEPRIGERETETPPPITTRSGMTSLHGGFLVGRSARE